MLAASETNMLDLAIWISGSKAVHADGSPMRLFHGTGAAFSTFSRNQDGAHYFSPSRDVAAWFAENNDRGWDATYEPRVITVHLALLNPKVLSLEQLSELIGDEDDPTGLDWTSMPSVIDQAKADGHDGMHLTGLREYDGSTADQWLAFSGDQIRIVDHGC